MLRYVYPLRTYLIVSGVEDPNVMAADWVVPLSFEPALVGVSVGHTRYTCSLIREGKEFVISVPTLELLEDVWTAGTLSGAKEGKVKKLGLSFIPSRKVKVASIKECQANIECKVVQQVETGDHTFFVGEIQNVTHTPAFNSSPDINHDFIMHIGGRRFTSNRSEERQP